MDDFTFCYTVIVMHLHNKITTTEPVTVDNFIQSSADDPENY